MWEWIVNAVFVVAFAFVSIAAAVCPPLYLYGTWKQEKYREHGRRTGEW